MTEHVEAWEQQPDETQAAYRGFRNYLEQDGTRTLAEAGRRTYGAKGVMKSGMVVGRIGEWARRHDWEARAIAYDRHLARIRQAEDERATIDMTRAHRREAAIVRRSLLEPALALARRIEQGRSSAQLEGLDIDRLVRLADRAGRGYSQVARFERLVHGIAERLEVSGPDGGPIEHEHHLTVEGAMTVLAPYLGCEPSEVPRVLAAKRRELRDAEEDTA